jgi:hypothetical protein
MRSLILAFAIALLVSCGDGSGSGNQQTTEYVDDPEKNISTVVFS